MHGHPTPMGVFSVIQKHKLHHSNIYSGAPMPFMQRITWSGVAMHAGVLPGYPASHGCIRMPMAFAVKMWNWTRMGARVIVTPGEITPASFSHPLLVDPEDRAAAGRCRNEPKPDAPPAVESRQGAPMPVRLVKPATSEASLELRSTRRSTTACKTRHGRASGSMPSRDQTRTADASGAIRRPPATMTDASSSAARHRRRQRAADSAEAEMPKSRQPAPNRPQQSRDQSRLIR